MPLKVTSARVEKLDPKTGKMTWVDLPITPRYPQSKPPLKPTSPKDAKLEREKSIDELLETKRKDARAEMAAARRAESVNLDLYKVPKAEKPKAEKKDEDEK